ncbi:MAG: polyamine aminopropyltransferase [Myxococcales bacterium]|nr:polyamine aminopropyltransferase [Myxococcales bacterium]
MSSGPIASGPTIAPSSDGVPESAPIHSPAILLAAFAVSTCGLIYELLAGTLASYVLGDSVTQFSTIIGTYLFAMGVGSWLSRFVDRQLVARFIEIETAVALIGGVSAVVLFVAFAKLAAFSVALYGLTFVIGVLVGLEIPLLMRIMEHEVSMKDLVARVLSADSLGALLASLAFPLFLIPQLGLVRSSFAVGAVNAAVAVACTYLLPVPSAPYRWFLRAQATLVMWVLVAGFVWSDRFVTYAEDQLFSDPVIYAKTTTYQRLVVTRSPGGFQLFINGALQFTSVDEHRYHEALVHPAASAFTDSGRPLRRCLVLGGGDGLAVRELLRHPTVEQVLVVDLDPAMTDLARELVPLRELNLGSLDDPRVTVKNMDAFVFVARPPPEAPFDLVIADFPDPSSYALGKLYTQTFYRRVSSWLAPDGVLVVQATSPLYARKSFWTVVHTIEASGFEVRPYHATVPSFGEWGFVLAKREPFEVPLTAPDLPLRYLSSDILPGLFRFSKDMEEVETSVQRLNDQILVRVYDDEWGKW